VEGIGMAGVNFLSFLEKIPMQVKYSINHYNPIQFHTAQHYYQFGTPVTSSSVLEPLVLNAPLVLYIIGGSNSIAKCLESNGGEIHCHGANQWVATVQRIEPDMLDRGNVAKGVVKHLVTHPRQLANPSFRSTVGNLSKALTVVTVQRAPANWPIGVRTTLIRSAQPHVLGFEELCRALNQAGTLPIYEGKFEI
jgi:hypothetical protein